MLRPIVRTLSIVLLIAFTLSVYSSKEGTSFLKKKPQVQITVEKNVEIPMRDGTILRADIFRPATGGKVPAILVRTIYNKESPLIPRYSIDPIVAAQAGYAAVYQDARGRYKSDGDYIPFKDEPNDGYDTIEWIAGQSWCTGDVGMTGLSYLAACQWLAASQKPPHLKAINPINYGSRHYLDNVAYDGGTFKNGYFLYWITRLIAPENMRRRFERGEVSREEYMRVVTSIDRLDELVQFMPLNELPLLKETGSADFYFDWMERRSADPNPVIIRDSYSNVEVPVLHVSGWYDYFLGGVLENFTRMRKEGGTAYARERQRLVIGPWDHLLGYNGAGYNFGILASTFGSGYTQRQLKFFDRYLKSEPNDWEEEPRVRLFVMGEGVWRDEQEWPLARTKYTPWYLHSDGRAKTVGGQLSTKVPGDQVTDAYLYDPRDPVPTVGGANGLPGLLIGDNTGPQDLREIEARSDVLVYSSEVLEQPMEVTGPLKVVLYAASSAPDTDFVAKLSDVHPDGSSKILSRGLVRAIHRNGYENASLIEPGKVYKYEIDLAATGNLFRKGHRIRVDITSSCFPLFDRNPNSGKEIGTDRYEDLTPAVQTIYHDEKRPSHILLPIIPRPDLDE